MQIIANIFSLLGHLIDIIVGFKFNEKEKILFFNIISSSCSFLAMLLLNSLAGCVSVVITILRLFFIYLKDKFHWKVDWAVIVFIIGYAFVFFDQDLLVASLMFIGNMVTFIPKWFCQRVQYLRIGAFVANIVFIFPSYMIGNFSSIPFYVLNIVTICLAYIKWYRVEKSVKVNENL